MRGKKHLVAAAVAAAAMASAAHAEVTINGAGASFPAPVYSPWTFEFKKQTGVQVNYQSVGSGAGIKQIQAKTVDFGASDEPLESKDLDASGLIQFPMLMGGVVPVVNIPGVENMKLKLTGKVLADLFLGKITKWNDPAVAALNPDLKLPDLGVVVVHRTDGSGTTWIFTNYLSKVSDDWKNGPGCDKAVKWPCGIGGEKNPGVANNVVRSKGAIGYVEYTYAVEAKIPMACLQNKDGKFVEPGVPSFMAAGANADWKSAPGFFMVLTDQPGADSWPITGVSYILVHKEQADIEKAKAMFKYFDWCYGKGGDIAKNLNYVPMPANVVEMVKASWKSVKSKDGKPVTE